MLILVYFTRDTLWENDTAVHVLDRYYGPCNPDHGQYICLIANLYCRDLSTSSMFRHLSERGVTLCFGFFENPGAFLALARKFKRGHTLDLPSNSVTSNHIYTITLSKLPYSSRISDISRLISQSNQPRWYILSLQAPSPSNITYPLTSPQSDGEEPTSPVAAADEVEVSADTTASKGQMSVLEALKGVLKLALIHDGLARGLREASKALDRRQAHMCVLNEACEEEAYKKLVVALCSEHKIPLIKVPDGKQLGEWAGLCECIFLRVWLLRGSFRRKPGLAGGTGLEESEGCRSDGVSVYGVGGWTIVLYMHIHTLCSFGIRTDSRFLLGVLDREGNARKVVNCSCVVVRDWGEESQERSILLNYFQTEQ